MRYLNDAMGIVGTIEKSSLLPEFLEFFYLNSTNILKIFPIHSSHPTENYFKLFH
jgi:hypothetical protein